MNEELLEFAHWVAKEVINDDNWMMNYWGFQEIACRKLVKLGIMEIEGDEYVYEYEDDEEDIFP